MALIAAAVILFKQPLRYGLDIAQDIESRYHFDLLPALLLLVVVFTFHQYRKRVQARADAMAARADATVARTESHRLAQLMAFSQALANALDRSALQQALSTHLPAFTRDRTFCVLIRSRDRWERFLPEPTGTPCSLESLELFAGRMGGGDGRAVEHQSPEADAGQDACFPLLASGTVVGVLGISNAPPLAEEERDVVSAAAALMAIAIKNLQLFVETLELSLRDGLTGCFNRRHALERLDGELRRARRTGRPLSVLMFDVDHFKTINDRFGHLRGDELLGAIGRRLELTTRSMDVQCRYGGDEFLVILPETPVLGAQRVAEGLRQDISSLRTGVSGEPVTISIGVATAEAEELDAKALIHRADEALYRAKNAGRNRLCVAIPSPTARSFSGPCGVEGGHVPVRTARESATLGGAP